MRSTTQTPRTGKMKFLLRLFLFASLVVACYMVGFFALGPAYRKMTSTQDLRVQTQDDISMPRKSASERSSEPPVQIIERKLPPRRPSSEDSSKENGIRLEIEQPVSERKPEPETEVQDPAQAEPAEAEEQLFRVEVKGFADEQAAGQAAEDLSAKGYTPAVSKVITEGGTEFRVQVGAFKNKDNADRVADDIRSQGYQVNLAGKEH